VVGLSLSRREDYFDRSLWTTRLFSTRCKKNWVVGVNVSDEFLYYRRSDPKLIVDDVRFLSFHLHQLLADQFLTFSFVFDCSGLTSEFCFKAIANEKNVW
jgi:hypothetical protein